MSISAPPRKRRKEARPSELLAAGLRLFVEKGYAATRLEDVAREAGVSKGTLYLYYENKEALFKAVILEGMVPVLAENEAIAARHAGSAFGLLELFLENWWAKIGKTAFAGIPKLIIAEAGNFPELAAFYYENVIFRARSMVSTALRSGMEKGEFRPLDIEAATDIAIAPILMLLIWQYSAGCGQAARNNPEHYLRTHMDLLRQGLQQEASDSRL
jgi:AcrR family transcriptional regulator